jgi:hypothetical protein
MTQRLIVAGQESGYRQKKSGKRLRKELLAGIFHGARSGIQIEPTHKVK